VDPDQIHPAVRDLHAANDTTIPILGVATVPFATDTYQSTINVLVSDHIHEVMLGKDWIYDSDAIVHLRRKVAIIEGHPHHLVDCPDHRRWMRRLKMHTDVRIPPRSQANLRCHVELKTVPVRNDVSSSWGTLPSSLGPGIYVASTLLPEGTLVDVPVRLMNTRNHVRFLKAGTVIGNLEPFTVVDSTTPVVDSVPRSNAAYPPVYSRHVQTMSSEQQDSAPDFVEELVSRVDGSTHERVTCRLRSLLQEYQGHLQSIGV